MTASLPIAIRAYDAATDLPFVYKAWISSYQTSDWAGVIPQHVAYSIQKVVINQLLARGMRITMAVNPDDRDQILGFVAYEAGPVIHYVFVKDFVRRRGTAKLLLASAGISPDGPVFITHRTADAKYLGNIVHKPGLARRKRAYDPALDGPLKP